jgi:hypothetical protein
MFEVINNGDLRFKAVLLDRVHFTWVFAGQDSFTILNNIYVSRDNTVSEKDLSPVEYLWREFSAIRYTLPNPSYSDVYAFCVTLTAGSTGDTALIGDIVHATAVTAGNFEQHYANFCAYRLQKAAIWGPDLSENVKGSLELNQGNADQYMQDVQWSSANRAFFCTEQGHIGLGPWIMENGDECWLPLGSTVPFVLRPIDEGRYKVLGQAYVNGMMEGEAVEGLGEEDFEEIVIAETFPSLVTLGRLTHLCIPLPAQQSGM